MSKILPLVCKLLFASLLLVTGKSFSQPAITSVSPASGPVGTTVTISGINFEPDLTKNVVYFGAVRATLTSASSGSLVAIVPAGATYQPLSVLNTSTHLTAFSSRPFTPTFTSPSGTGIAAGYYSAKTDFATGTLPYFVAVGDLDGDGKPDLAIVNANANTLSVFRNNAAAGISFEAKTDFATGDGPLSVAIGDVDGDGKPDIVVANERSATVAVYRNTSTPSSITAASFASPVSFATGEHPYSVALGDLDGDGKVDITVANSQSNTVSVLRNTATAGSVDASSFAARVDLATGLNPRFVAVGDIDGDGKPEIVVVNQQSNTVSVLRNTATSGAISAASFATKADFMTGTSPIGVVIGDLDGDNKSDLAVANNGSNTISVFRNTSTSGTIDMSSLSAKTDFSTTAQPFALALGDLDGDGKPDIAIANSVSGGLSVLRNTSSAGSIGAGSFAANVQFNTGGYPLSVAIADLDGDGIPEALASNGANIVSVLKSGLTNRPVITSFSPESGPVGTTVTINGANFNASSSGNTVYFGAVKVPVTGGSSISLTVTVPVGATYQPFSVLNNANGLTGTSPKPYITTFTNPLGSGIPANYYLPKTDFTPGVLPNSVAFGDMDGDGKPDMVIANAGSGTVSVYKNISSTGTINAASFAAKVDFTTVFQPTTVALADMDGDGKLDIVTVNNDSGGPVSILRNTSTTGSITSSSFASQVYLTNNGSAPVPYSISLTDVDGDGKPDISIVNYMLSNAVSIFRNVSVRGSITTSSFSAPVRVAAGSPASGYALAYSDLDGDGKPDLILSHGSYTSDSTLSVFRNISTSGSITMGSFAAPVLLKTGGVARTIVSGDLDGDGKPDLLIAHMGGSSTLTMIRNMATPGNLTAASFAAKVEIPVSSNVNAVTINDLDGDGKPDLAVANANTFTLSVHRNVSVTGTLNASSFAPRVEFATGIYPLNLTSGDLDGDGIPEIAVVNTNSTSNTFSVFKTMKASTVPVIYSISPASGPVGTSVTITGNIFNPDIAGNTVYFGSVKATVTSASMVSLTVTAPSGANYQPVTVLDNTTGLTAYGANPFVYTFNTSFNGNIPAQYYLPRTDFSTGILPYSMAFGDLDGDGKTDMAVVNANENTVSVFRNLSSGGLISTASFAAKVDFATGNEPRGIAIADVDGDGKPDMVVTNSNSSSVSVYKNTATSGSITAASFAGGVQFPVGDHPYAVAVSDLNGDGKPELVAANLFSATISVLRNTGSTGVINASSFAAKADIVTASNPRFVALGDLDGDGKTDIAVTNEQAASVSLFRNVFSTGTLDASSFAPKVDFTTGANPLGIAINDLDGDGKPDLAVVNYGVNSVSVFRNTASVGSINASSFAARVDFATGSGPFALALGDANGDSKTDLLTVNSGNSSFSILRNVSVSGAIVSSSFVRTDFATGGYPVYVAFGDLSGDGIAEIASVNAANNSVSVLQVSNPASALIPAISSVSPINAPAGAAVTITGTNFDTAPGNNTVYFGAVKAVVTNGSSSSLTATVPAGATYQPVSVLNTPTGLAAFSPASFNPTFTNPFGSGIAANFYRPNIDISLGGRFPFSIALGDVDGDGKPDLAVSNSSGTTATIYRNISSTGTVDASSFGPAVNFTSGRVLSTILFIDIDGDGKLDLVVSNLDTNYFTILRNTSVPGTIDASSFAPAVNYTIYAQASPYSLATGDVDGDGRPDIAIANSQANTVSVFRNMATPGVINGTSFTTSINFATGTTPRFVSLSDIDGDKKPDLVVLNEGSNNLSVYLNAAITGSITAASFTGRTDFATGADPYTLAIGDLDGDGKADIAVNNHNSNTVSVLRNTSVAGGSSASLLASKIDFATGNQPYMTVIADADGDGKPDLLSVNSSANTLSVLRNTSVSGAITLSSFTGKVDFATGAYPISLAVGDIDGDGLAEVLTGNAGKSTLSLLQINKSLAVAEQSAAKLPVTGSQATDEAGMGMQLYPNPTNGEFTVQLSGIHVAGGSMEILNESGKTLEKRSLNFGSKAVSFTQKLSLRSYPEGIYFIKLTTAKGVQLLKVVVQR